jgi:hypothetical protein
LCLSVLISFLVFLCFNCFFGVFVFINFFDLLELSALLLSAPSSIEGLRPLP